MSLIQTPVSVIGSSSTGTYFRYDTASEGAILRKIGVWAGGWQLRGVRVWFTNSDTPQTFGTPNAGPYKEFEFQAGERMTRLSLWGNGAGTRSGGIRFYTTTGREFFHHMTSWSLQQEFAIDVASGLCVGIRGWSSEDIVALGFPFLLPVMHARMINVRYPTLDLESAGIQPVTIRDFHDENHSQEFPKDWSNSGSTTTTNASSWSLTTGLEYHASVSVSASIPLIVEGTAEVGWGLSVSSTYDTSFEESETTEWTRSGVLGPRQWLSFRVTTRRGTITLPYEGTMEITLSTSTRFSYSLKGLYTGVNYSRIEIRTEMGSLDSTAARDDNRVTRTHDVVHDSTWTMTDHTSTTTKLTRAKKTTSSTLASNQKQGIQLNAEDNKTTTKINELHLEYN